MAELIYYFVTITILAFMFGSMIYLGLDLDPNIRMALVGYPFGALSMLCTEILMKLNNKDNKI